MIRWIVAKMFSSYSNVVGRGESEQDKDNEEKQQPLVGNSIVDYNKLLKSMQSKSLPWDVQQHHNL